MRLMAEGAQDMLDYDIQGLSVFYFPTFSTCLSFRSLMLPVRN